MRKTYLILSMVLVLCLSVVGLAAAKNVRVIVEVDQVNEAMVDQLKGNAVKINYEFPEIDMVAMTVKEGNINTVKGLPGVVNIYRDHKVTVSGTPITAWDLDMIDVEKVHNTNNTEFDGTGVYVAVLDTGLLPHWKDYFPEEKIAKELGAGFHNPQSNVNPGAWVGVHAHGTHVTSSIIGYNFYGDYVDGVAPGSKIIPVKVLSNQGSGYSSAVTAGILYVANLKAEGIVSEPIVINMSLGSSLPDESELEAIKYAIDNGVVVVTSAGNEGETGMGYPGAYEEVISVGAVGWKNIWTKGWNGDVTEDNVADTVYVADYSSRELVGQELDVLAPGDNIVGPYTVNGAAHPPRWAQQDKMGEYYFLGGTSMASPHVAGVAALMLDKNELLTHWEIESILKDTALHIPAGSVFVPGDGTYSWGSDATGSGLIMADEAIQAVNQ